MTAPCWAQVSLMGHTQLWGYATEEERYGAKGIRIDVPATPGRPGSVHWHPPGALFGVRELTEEQVRQHLTDDPWVSRTAVRAIRGDAYVDDVDEDGQTLDEDETADDGGPL